MAAQKKRGGGPKTEQGKSISSKNATTHGLTARQWLNDDEQMLYNHYLEALTEEHQPQSPTEHLYIAKLAECSVRSIRASRVESAHFELARAEASNPINIIRNIEGEANPGLESDVIDALHQRRFNNKPYDKWRWELFIELSEIHLSDISGWQFVINELPGTYRYIYDQCQKERIDIESFIKRYSGKNSGIRFVMIGTDDEEKPTMTEAELNENAHRLTGDMIGNYLQTVIKRLSKELYVNNIIRELDTRSKLLQDAATPETQKMNLIHRYRTSDDKLFSKTLGELLELKKLRSIN